MNTSYLLVAFGVFAIALVWAKIWLQFRPNRYHRKIRRQSQNAFKRMQAMVETHPGSIITYMRKMNPHAVEEVVLDAAEAAGHKVKRNSAYTGDGGIDGEILVDGKWHLVQTKRYAKTINPQHVLDFNEVCKRRRQPGLFVHCGRTGNKSRDNAAAHVRFISGPALVDLIAGKSLNSNTRNKSAA